MKKFNTFYFEKFEFDKTSLKARFFYSFDKGEFFEEIIDFNVEDFSLNKEVDYKKIDNLLFNLHIALGISYYKLFPTKELIIESGFLNNEQIKFWHKFYRNGLGEFFIKNNFDFESILNFNNGKDKNSFNKYSKVKVTDDKSLLMWGGGKDSIVSSILLEEEGNEFDAFIFGKIDKIKKNTLKVLGKKTMLVKRELSNNLFKLNNEGYYNGHVPITGIIAFVSLISGYLYGYKNIVLSNEKSADEENIIWKGLKINHQYSKSREFEKDFRNYVFDYISEDLNYFSKLGDKYELEIAEIFSNKASKYFTSFSSCNRNFKIKGGVQKVNWCLECEKCCFVYLILSSFLDDKNLNIIFGEDLFDNIKLINTFKGLLGLTENKPFECVGTYDESLESAYKNLIKYKSKIKSGEIEKLPYILDILENEIEKQYEKKNS